MEQKDINKFGRPANRKNRNVLTVIFLCLVSLMALSFCIVVLLNNAQLKRENEAINSELSTIKDQEYYTQTQVTQMVNNAQTTATDDEKNRILNQIQTSLEDGNGTNQTFRDLFTDKLVVTDSGHYYFVDINDAITKSPFLSTDFALAEDGFMRYVGTNENVSAVAARGIDVSKHNGEIDWKKVADSGITYAIIRVGVRGYTEGKIAADEQFENNIKGATANGIAVGVYFYSQAINEDEAYEEAKFVLDAIEPYSVTYPVVFDIEKSESSDARTKDLTTAENTAIARKFCDTVSGAGYTPMIYGNIYTFAVMLDLTQFSDIDTWIAYYNTPQYYPYNFSIWQYSSTGTVDGISDKVDLNISLKDWTAK